MADFAQMIAQLARSMQKPNIPDVKPWKPTTQPPGMEQQFQSDIKNTQWFKEFVQKYGEEPNFDDPNYNYREAWRQGVGPNQRNLVDKMYHWADKAPSGAMLKSPYHPTAWMESFMQQYPGANPEDENDPTVALYRQAWQKKYPPRQ